MQRALYNGCVELPRTTADAKEPLMPATEPLAPHLADFAALDPVRCPCGWARRAFAEVPGSPVSVHRVEIEADAALHYHKEHTEVYYFLDCSGGSRLELDGQIIPVHEGMTVLIPPFTRHRALGRMTILNIVTPPFDPADEWFD